MSDFELLAPDGRPYASGGAPGAAGGADLRMQHRQGELDQDGIWLARQQVEQGNEPPLQDLRLPVGFGTRSALQPRQPMRREIADAGDRPASAGEQVSRNGVGGASQTHEAAVAQAGDPVAADEIAAPLQNTDDVSCSLQHLQRLCRDLDAAAIRVVVEDDLKPGCLRRRQRMGREPRLRRPVVIGHAQQQSRGTGLLGGDDLGDRPGGRIAADGCDHRIMPARDAAGGCTERFPLRTTQRRAFARRRADHDAVGALRDLPENEAFQRAIVDRLLIEGRNQRSEHAVKPVIHGLASE